VTGDSDSLRLWLQVADLVENGDAVRALDVDGRSVLQQQRGQVGLAQIERPVKRRLAAERPRVQVAAAVDEACQDVLEVDHVVVDADGDVQRPDCVARVTDVCLTT